MGTDRFLPYGGENIVSNADDEFGCRVTNADDGGDPLAVEAELSIQSNLDLRLFKGQIRFLPY